MCDSLWSPNCCRYSVRKWEDFPPPESNTGDSRTVPATAAQLSAGSHSFKVYGFCLLLLQICASLLNVALLFLLFVSGNKFYVDEYIWITETLVSFLSRNFGYSSSISKSVSVKLIAALGRSLAFRQSTFDLFWYDSDSLSVVMQKQAQPAQNVHRNSNLIIGGVSEDDYLWTWGRQYCRHQRLKNSSRFHFNVPNHASHPR